MVRETVFKDSLNFFKCRLDALPKTFRLQHLVEEKPWFPHLYNTERHLNKQRNSLPKAHYYDPDRMSVADRERFFRWYNEARERTPFQLRRDLVEYCGNDVAILREAALKFRQQIMELADGLDPFVRPVTIAGLAMAVYRKQHLPAHTLVNLPEGGYNHGERASTMALKFMRLYELLHPGVRVQTAEWSVGEARVQDTGYRLDGLVHRGAGQRQLALEFLGCYYHGGFHQGDVVGVA